jgi:hypothetical protein
MKLYSVWRKPARNGDPGYARRLAIAFAFALALHEILAGFLPRRAPGPPDERVAAQTVTIVHRPKPAPKPTPVPTPPAPPNTPAPQYTLAPAIAVRAPAPKAAATPRRILGGAAAHRRVAHPEIARQAPPQSLAEGEQAGAQNGGAGSGAGPGNGTGGLGGTGTGTGGTGTGNGGDANSAPCGTVYLLPGNVSYRPDGTVVQEVEAKVVLRDGSVQQGLFPYPFTYPAERLNPFTHDDALSADKGTPVQQPPPGVDISAAPPAVQVVLKYTNPATGTSTLKDCPAASPAP